MTKAVAVASFNKLISEISAIYKGAQKALASAYWQIGRCIVEIEQKGEVRAHYGQGLLKEISGKLSSKLGKGFSVDNLQNMRIFYLKYKKYEAPRNLSWTQYLAISAVDDEAQRKRLEKLAKTKNISSRRLKAIVKEKAASLKSATEKLENKKKIIKRPNDLYFDTFKKARGKDMGYSEIKEFIDCGFFVYLPSPGKGKVNFVEKPSHTYRANVEKVVDGDTLAVTIDVGFKSFVRARLRLRGIDTPEIGTPQGEKARRFVLKVVPKGSKIVIKSYKTDIYGRFVADVFYSEEEHSFDEILDKGEFLNSQLLALGLAKEM